MDLSILRKKISTFKTEGGYLKNVSDELLGELLNAWENWTGPSAAFYSGIGVDYRKIASLIGRAKKLKREGLFPDSDFKEISVQLPMIGNFSGNHGIEIVWDDGRIIRFSSTELLLDFLGKVHEVKKVA